MPASLPSHPPLLLPRRFSLFPCLSWTILRSRTRARPRYERRNLRGLLQHVRQIKPRGIMLPRTYESAARSRDRANIGEAQFLRTFSPWYFLFLEFAAERDERDRSRVDWFSNSFLGLQVRKNAIIRRRNGRVQRKQPRDRKGVGGKWPTRKSLPARRVSIQRHANFSLREEISFCSVYFHNRFRVEGRYTRERRTCDNRKREREREEARRDAGIDVSRL